VRRRTIPTEQWPLIDEVRANLCMKIRVTFCPYANAMLDVQPLGALGIRKVPIQGRCSDIGTGVKHTPYHLPVSRVMGTDCRRFSPCHVNVYVALLGQLNELGYVHTIQGCVYSYHVYRSSDCLQVRSVPCCFCLSLCLSRQSSRCFGGVRDCQDA
jgi:hypothetical protein